MSEKAKREYKDTVFRMGAKIPENALSIYNALNGTNYDDVGLIDFNTLENVIYMNVKNDVSFLIVGGVNHYEHQSTYTPNMPLRDLMYVADLFQKYTKDKTIYSTKLVKVPTPHFVVFYNGTENQPEYMEQRLSDSYEVQEDNPELELVVRIYNINPGMNEELKKRCPFLREYTAYVQKVRTYSQTMDLTKAVERAVDECIQEGILREFLLNQKSEVVKMSIYEYDEEREMKLIRQGEREIGIEIGRGQGRAEGRNEGILSSIRNLIQNTKVSMVDAMKMLGIPEEEKEKYIKMMENN